MNFNDWCETNGYAGSFPKKEHMEKAWNAAIEEAVKIATNGYFYTAVATSDNIATKLKLLIK